MAKTQAESKAAEMFADDMDDYGGEFALDDVESFGVSAQWSNGSSDRDATDVVAFGGIEVPMKNLKPFLEAELTLKISDIRHGSDIDPAVILPLANLIVINYLSVAEFSAKGFDIEYSRDLSKIGKYSDWTPRTWVYCLIEELRPFTGFSPVILSLKGAQSGAFYQARRDFQKDILDTANRLIEARSNRRVSMPFFSMYMGIHTPGREVRRNERGDEYSVAPLCPSWDKAIAKSTLEDLHEDLPGLKVPKDVKDLIRLDLWEAGLQWKASKESKIFEPQLSGSGEVARSVEPGLTALERHNAGRPEPRRELDPTDIYQITENEQNRQWLARS